jgi:hypothetical protein
MKKVLLLPLIAIGLALVPAKQANAQVSIGAGGVGIGFGYRAAITAIMPVIHITERITILGGRTTTATTDTTSIISVTIAIKTQRLV